MASGECVKHVVADSGAFIRNANLNTIGEKIYVVPDVIKEIRDKATRQRLEVLPYQLIPKTPTPECIKIVTEFSKKTGDFRSLSAVDIKVLALTYQLEKENVGIQHINTTPNRKIEWNTTKHLLEKSTDIAGFYIAKRNTSSRTASECTSTSDVFEGNDQRSEQNEDTSSDQNVTEEPEIVNNTKSDGPDGLEEGCQTDSVNNDKPSNEDSGIKSSHEDSNDSAYEDTDNQVHPARHYREGAMLPSDLIEDEEEEDEGIEDDNEDEDDDDDEGGWITPSNIKTMKEKMGVQQTEKASVTVGCVTTDFAMQNVLLQMGLNVISVDGMLIKKAKSFVQRCFACMKVTMNMMKTFCPHCGNNTLQKISMNLEEDGTIRYFLSRRRPLNTKGLKYSLPMPKGGKHANNPVLVADQPIPQQRTSKKARQRMDVFDPDYLASQSPFSMRDITSKAAQLGISGNNQFKRRNPNENRRGGRRK